MYIASPTTKRVITGRSSKVITSTNYIDAMINAKQQLDKSELQITLERIMLEGIMLERSMEWMSKKSELESELTANNNMFDEVTFEDPSDNIEVIFHIVPIVVISKGDMMKPRRDITLACLTTTTGPKPRRPRRSSRRGYVFIKKASRKS